MLLDFAAAVPLFIVGMQKKGVPLIFQYRSDSFISMRTFAIVFFLVQYFCFALPCAGAQSDGIDLFIKACQNRGTNSTLLRSFYVEFERTYYTPQRSQAELEKLAHQYASEIRQQLGDNHPRIKQMTDIPATVKSLNKQFNSPQEERFRVLYRVDDVSRRLAYVAVDAKVDGRWEPKSEFIGDHKGKKDNVSAFYISNMSRVDVGNLYGGVEDFVNMGRLQGEILPAVEALLMMGTDLTRHEFAQANIDKFRQETEKQRATGKIDPLVLVGQTEYDKEGSNAYIVESKKNGIIAERFWIDPSHGYVCPLVQYFDDKGNMLKEYRSSGYFLEERSGLWFPTQYSEFTAAQKGNNEERFDYRINSGTLKANFPVADDAFCIEVKENLIVADSRNSRDGNGVRYKAFQNGTLSLAKDGLDLDAMGWLARERGITIGGLGTKSYVIVRMFLMVIGGIMVLLGLYRMRNGRKTKSLF